jgi:hypothetical protein
MRSLARMLTEWRELAQPCCSIIWFPRAQVLSGYARDRPPMCHYRHQHWNRFITRLADITAHVDFTAMAVAAQDAGLDNARVRRPGFFL